MRLVGKNIIIEIKFFTKEFIKEPAEFTKEFIKASRQIYKLISMNPHISTAKMAESMGLSTR
ncbi:MAG: AAA family ATPase, partial [Alphaproteobacteria bacterium]|nr:AAA family ATPase [Alphaproteobacteria bacterium]